MKKQSRQAGFTLIELLVVMGLMSMFLTFLVQILFSSTEIFQSGQRSQDLSRRSKAAGRPLFAALQAMQGIHRETDGKPDARLLVQWLDLPQSENQVQVLRATVGVSAREETQILQQHLGALAQAQAKDLGIAEEDLLTELREQVGASGRAEMLLLPWPSGDEEQALMQIRRLRFLPDTALPMEDAKGRSLLQLQELDALLQAEPQMEVLASGVLHMEYRFWSQYSHQNSATAQDGPEWVWDSARAGWLSGNKDARHNFSMDLGPQSMHKPHGHVFPRWLQVTLVVGHGAAALPDARLAQEINGEDRECQLLGTQNLYLDPNNPYLKLGSEWVRYASLQGNKLLGLQRGQRGTKAKRHKAGTGLRVGRSIVRWLPLLHGRDNWNG